MRLRWPPPRARGSRPGIALGILACLLPVHSAAIVIVADVDLAAPANAVQVRDERVYVGTESGLEIFDLTDPRSPQAASLTTPSPVSEFVLEGDLAYLACEGGLRIADVSDPNAPEELGHLDLPGFSIDVELAADGVHAFVSTVAGVRVIDVSDPGIPVEIDLVDVPQLRGLARIGDALFGVAGEHGFAGVAVIDVSDPTAPVVLPSIPPYGNPDQYGSPGTAAIGVDADHLWLFDTSQYFQPVWRRFDVTEPEAPALLDTVFPQREDFDFGILSGLSLGGGLLDWLRCANGGCHVMRMDLADPGAPTELGRLKLTELSYRAAVAASGERAYVANGARLRVVDFSQPQWPSALDSIGLPGEGEPSHVEDIDVIGSLAYVAAGARGLHVVDVSDPTRLVAVGHRDFNYQRRAVAVAAAPPLAFVADPAGLRIATVANPANPYILADPLVPAYDLELLGGLAYAASWDDGLVVWSAAEPTMPERVGSASVTRAVALAVTDGLAYVVGLTNAIAKTYELVVVDVTDPAAPHELGRVDLAGSTNFHQVDVALRGSLAYVALDNDVHVVDVSSPDAPLPLGAFSVCGYWADLEIRGDRLFAAGAYCGLGVFDLANPIRPFELGVVGDDATTSYVAGRIAILGREPGVAGSFDSLASFDLGPEYGTAPEADALAGSCAALGTLAGIARRAASRRRRGGAPVAGAVPADIATPAA